jgi:hypothetical protein
MVLMGEGNNQSATLQCSTYRRALSIKHALWFRRGKPARKKIPLWRRAALGGGMLVNAYTTHREHTYSRCDAPPVLMVG